MSAKGPKQNHLGLLRPLILARVAAQGKGRGLCLGAALEAEPWSPDSQGAFLG